jgi:hypothetical protein
MLGAMAATLTCCADIAVYFRFRVQRRRPMPVRLVYLGRETLRLASTTGRLHASASPQAPPRS